MNITQAVAKEKEDKGFKSSFGGLVKIQMNLLIYKIFYFLYKKDGI